MTNLNCHTRPFALDISPQDMPDMCYRASIMVVFRMDPRLLAGMTTNSGPAQHGGIRASMALIRMDPGTLLNSLQGQAPPAGMAKYCLGEPLVFSIQLPAGMTSGALKALRLQDL